MQKVQFQHFYPYAELTSFLYEAARENPDFVHLDVLTRTEEGREVFLVTLADFSLGDAAEQRGAYYVQSGIHANEGAGTTAALHLMETILSSKNRQEILRKTIFYIIPRVNPDGVEYSISKCASIRSKFSKLNGLPNAVIPSDLNGDGMILSMRWEDPLGTMKEYPGIPGLMVRREPGDTEGPFYSVATEGYIENYDGGPLQFGMRPRDLNRSLPVHWAPTANAADYPCRDIESRAVAEFMVTHPNIFAGIDYHCGSCGILRPLMTPDTDLSNEDRHTILDVGKIGSDITGLPLISVREYKAPDDPPAPPHGCSNEWAYHVLGISHYVIELGNGYNGIGLKTEEILKNWRNVENGPWLKRIVERHQAFGSEILVPWKKFQHPQLGEVEIGGFKDGQAYYMYPPDMENLIPKTTAFLLEHSQMGPKLILGNLETTNLGGGIFRVRAMCMNIGRFGTTVMSGSEGYLAQSNVSVTDCGSQNASILSRPAQYTFRQLPSMGREPLEWFLRAEPGEEITITAAHPKSVPAAITFTLN